MSDETQKITRIDRSAAGLTDAMFAAIDKLNAGVINADECRAIAQAGRTVVGMARVELDYQKLANTAGKSMSSAVLPDIGAAKQLGHAEK